MMNNKNFPVNIDGETHWISRSMSTACFIFVNYNSELCVIANKRGDGSPDFKGYWCVPCGYLDYNESLEECAVREVFEETGLKIDLKELNLFGINSDPVNSNKQNVTVRYYTIMNDFNIDDFSFDNSEPNEVEEIKAIPISEVDNYKWSFNHDKLIKEIISQKI